MRLDHELLREAEAVFVGAASARSSTEARTVAIRAVKARGTTLVWMAATKVELFLSLSIGASLQIFKLASMMKSKGQRLTLKLNVTDCPSDGKRPIEAILRLAKHVKDPRYMAKNKSSTVGGDLPRAPRKNTWAPRKNTWRFSAPHRPPSSSLYPPCCRGSKCCSCCLKTSLQSSIIVLQELGLNYEPFAT